MAATKTRQSKDLRKFKWENRLSKNERAFVSGLEHMLWDLARENTPKRWRLNDEAVERSFMEGLKVICRSAQSYDPAISKPTTYTYRIVGAKIREYWRSPIRKAQIDLPVISENLSMNGDSVSVFDDIMSGDRLPIDVISDTEQVELGLEYLKSYRPKWHRVICLKYGFPHNCGQGNYEVRPRTEPEVAEIVGTSVRMVAWTVKHSLIALRNFYQRLN